MSISRNRLTIRLTIFKDALASLPPPAVIHYKILHKTTYITTSHGALDPNFRCDRLFSQTIFLPSPFELGCHLLEQTV
jgi:hypothetical protein